MGRRSALLSATALLLCGCSRPALAPADVLTAALPKVSTPFVATVFKARPGLATAHVKNGDSLVGTLSIEDLLEQPEESKKLAAEGVRETSMGGGRATLVAGRFKIEATSLSPVVSEKIRDSWLAGFDRTSLERLP